MIFAELEIGKYPVSNKQ